MLLKPRLIIIITSVLIGISYNTIVNKFTSQFEKIFFGSCQKFQFDYDPLR